MKSNPSIAPPAEFLARMRKLLPATEFAAFQAAFDQPTRIGLRVNTLKISVPDFISIAPFSLAPVGDWEPAGFLVTDDSRPGRHPYHDAGLYYLQDPSAMVAAALLAPASGERVLDLAAAPGGKATHLLNRMAGPAPPGEPISALRRGLSAAGLLVANDVHGGRARLLADSLARWGAVTALVTQAEPEQLAASFGPIFDRVLIDAPCSGEGMLRRGEPVEWNTAIVAACARRQRGILAHAPALARPGGRLLYSTCTFAPEENEAVIANFLAGAPDFSLIEPERYEGFERGRPDWSAAPPEVAGQLSGAVRLWPHRFPGEGHFLALLGREGEQGDVDEAVSMRLVPLSGEHLRLWRAFAAASLTVELPEERIHVHNERLYLRPAVAMAVKGIRIVRYGLWLGEVRPGRFQPAPDLALALRASDATAALDLRPDDPLLAAYLAGAELPQAGADGWVLVAVDGFGIGWAKRAAGRLKNHYPRGWRRVGRQDLT